VGFNSVLPNADYSTLVKHCSSKRNPKIGIASHPIPSKNQKPWDVSKRSRVATRPFVSPVQGSWHLSYFYLFRFPTLSTTSTALPCGKSLLPFIVAPGFSLCKLTYFIHHSCMNLHSNSKSTGSVNLDQVYSRGRYAVC
jgi:hypothetical protein